MTKIISASTAILLFVALIVLKAPIWLIIISGVEVVTVMLCFIVQFLRVCTQKDNLNDTSTGDVVEDEIV